MHKHTEVVLDFHQSKGVISPMIYGHMTEHIGGVFYDGLWVGENSNIDNIHGFRKALVDSLKKINPPVIRWPGGCFAETYDWRDGIGPRDKRPERVNWWYANDKRTESNHVGTHEFMDLCRMVGAKPYLAANMASTTPMHIRNWIEYCNFPADGSTLARERGKNGDIQPFGVEYWGIGNETWGGGGEMSPEMNAREYVRYSTICRSAGSKNLKFIICGASDHDVQWTSRTMKEWAKRRHNAGPTWGMSVHYYCGTAGAPQSFTNDQWYQQLFQADYMRRIIRDHRAAMDEFDPDRKIGIVVDEWGCWHKDGSGPSNGANLFEQQSSMRDAMVAAMTLNIFNNRCDVVTMTNIAQLCNNLHSLYLAAGENLVETPNYHVYAMYKSHQGAQQIAAAVHADTLEREGFSPMDMLSVSASRKEGVLTVTLANLSIDDAQTVKLNGLGGSCAGKAVITTLHHEDVRTCNTFEMPNAVTPVVTEVTLQGNPEIEVPAAGIVSVVVQTV